MFSFVFIYYPNRSDYLPRILNISLRKHHILLLSQIPPNASRFRWASRGYAPLCSAQSPGSQPPSRTNRKGALPPLEATPPFTPTFISGVQSLRLVPRLHSLTARGASPPSGQQAAPHPPYLIGLRPLRGTSPPNPPAGERGSASRLSVPSFLRHPSLLSPSPQTPHPRTGLTRGLVPRPLGTPLIDSPGGATPLLLAQTLLFVGLRPSRVAVGLSFASLRGPWRVHPRSSDVPLPGSARPVHGKIVDFPGKLSNS